MQDKAIVIIGPYYNEIDHIWDVLENKTNEDYGNFTIVNGYYHGKNIIAVRCLIGMVNAASATTYVINKYHPSMVIVNGTSGGHNKNVHQGDIILGKTVVEIHNRKTPHKDEGDGIDITSWENMGAQMMNSGEIQRVYEFHSDEGLLKLASEVTNKYGKVHIGTIASGDQWSKEIDYINYLHNSLNSDCEEMEGFAVAQVCDMLKTKFIAIRIISNNELFDNEKFDDIYGLYCQEFTLKFIEKL